MTVEVHNRYFNLLQMAIESHEPEKVYLLLEQLSSRHLGKPNGVSPDEFGHLRSGYFPGFVCGAKYLEYVDGTVIPIEYLRWHYKVNTGSSGSRNYAEMALKLGNRNQRR